MKYRVLLSYLKRSSTHPLDEYLDDLWTEVNNHLNRNSDDVRALEALGTQPWEKPGVTRVDCAFRKLVDHVQHPYGMPYNPKFSKKAYEALRDLFEDFDHYRSIKYSFNSRYPRNEQDEKNAETADKELTNCLIHIQKLCNAIKKGDYVIKRL